MWADTSVVYSQKVIIYVSETHMAVFILKKAKQTVRLHLHFSLTRLLRIQKL